MPFLTFLSYFQPFNITKMDTTEKNEIREKIDRLNARISELERVCETLISIAEKHNTALRRKRRSKKMVLKK